MDTPLFIHDSELGRLRGLGPGWYRLPRRLKLSRIKGSFLVTLDLKRDRQLVPVQAFQRERVTWLRKSGPELRDAMQAAIAIYYRPYRTRNLPQFIQYCGADWTAINVPELNADKEIWRLVSPQIIEVMTKDHLFGYDVEIGFGARWDEEHGVAVKFRDGVVVGVTEVGCCGIGDMFSPESTT